MFYNVNKWTEAHLTSCRSYRRNNRFAKRLEKWDEIYNRVFDCETATTTTTTTAEPTTTTTTTAEPGPDCGCYAPDEEIPIENDKCVLDLSSVSDVTGDWSFAFELKINSLPTEPSDPPYNSGIDWFAMIVTGNGSETILHPKYPFTKNSKKITKKSFSQPKKVLKDGYNGFPRELLGMGHYPSEKHPNVFVKYTVKGSSHSPSVQFETNQWYKELFAKLFSFSLYLSMNIFSK